MNWNEFRKSYSQKYGSTTRQQLSHEYALYKQKSPSRRLPSPLKTIPSRQLSPTKNQSRRLPSPLKPIPSRQLLTKNQSRQLSNQSSLSPQRGSKLTLKDMNELAKGKKFLIVVVYADWCGHCQEMKKRLGSKMKDTDKIIFLEDQRVDDSLKDFFPHVYYYQDGARQNDLTVEDVYTYLHA